MQVGHAIFFSLLELFYSILNFYIWILIVSAVLSWLIAFEIVNPHNKIVRVIGDLTYRLTEPALRPIRRVLPSIGGLDLSPLALIFIIYFLQSFIRRLVF
jgi:YggT family protein